MQVSLVYRSRCKIPADHASFGSQMDAIEKAATRFNTAQSVTGVLIYKDGVFYQLLEGDFSSVTNAFNRIILDKRHDEIELITFSEIAQRSFNIWHMQNSMRMIKKDPNRVNMKMKFVDRYITSFKSNMPLYADLLKSVYNDYIHTDSEPEAAVRR
jgi:Sensors of blue-light using FAD